MKGRAVRGISAIIKILNMHCTRMKYKKTIQEIKRK